MYTSIRDLAKLIVPLSQQQKSSLEMLKLVVEEEEYKKARYLVRTGKADMFLGKLNLSSKILPDKLLPKLTTRSKDKEVRDYVKNLNSAVEKTIREASYREFSGIARDRIPAFIAPQIFGLDLIKQAAMLQLFCTEPVHILLLGDPGTGKTEILRAAADLTPVSSFGLGSGISGAGLGVMARGDEIVYGLLPRADGGLCAIDELNLVKREDYAFLYSAMEKGFITYTKSNKNLTIDPRVKVLATANPKGDKFVGRIVSTLRDQIPFDSALLSRFHITFLVRKPGVEGFLHITKKIVRSEKVQIPKDDLAFLKDYVGFADHSVDFPKAYEPKVVKFMKYIKECEEEFLIEATPRIVVGFVRLAKASARLSLRDKVTDEDLSFVQKIVTDSLFLRER